MRRHSPTSPLRFQVPRTAGFSLVEVLVALVIIAVGLLGIAKIQALAYAETGTATLRSLAAIQASSLAASMHADRAYWGSAGGISNPTYTVTSGAVTSTDPNLSAVLSTSRVLPASGSGCTPAVASPHCTATELAAADLQTWAATLRVLLPMANTDATTVTCSTANVPVNCTISIMWTERMVGTNAQTQATALLANGGLAAPTYTLYVEP